MGFLPSAAESNPTHLEPTQVFLLERITESSFMAAPKGAGEGAGEGQGGEALRSWGWGGELRNQEVG